MTGTVDQELLARNEYLAAENRIMKAQLKDRLKLSDAERGALGEIGHLSLLKSPSAHGINLARKAMADDFGLPPQDGQLMPQGDEFEFQRGAAANPEQEQGPEGGQSVSMPMTV